MLLEKNKKYYFYFSQNKNNYFYCDQNKNLQLWIMVGKSESCLKSNKSMINKTNKLQISKLSGFI